MMKKKYIIPNIEVASCLLEGFIAASKHDGDTTVDDEKKDIDTSDEVIIKAKQFTAWDTWDD